jgi:alpha-mannosidase
MPQILKKCGMEYFVSNKMSTWNDTNRFPHNHFIWKGIDGTGIAACVPPTHFITWNTPEQVIANWDAFQEKSVSPETLNMFGFGDGGSGVTEPMLEYMTRLSRVPGLPEIRHCRADEFLDNCFADPAGLETWDGELYLEMHRGTFTTMGKLKKGNRSLEIALRDAEMLAAFAALEGAAYPAAELETAWKKLLVNQFHDILPGTHIAPVTTDALNDYDELAAVTTEIISTAAENLFAPAEASSLAVVNTLGEVRRGTQFLPEIMEVISSKEVTCQPGDRDGVPGLWVELPELSGGGRLTLETTATAANAIADEVWYCLEADRLDMPLYTIRFNPDGSIVSLFDKTARRELTQSGGTLNRLHVYHDYPGLYDAWDILPNYADKEDDYQVATPLRLVESGPLFIVLETELKLNRSVWKQRIRLFRHERRIEFDHEVDWHERNRLAKAEFDFNLLSRKLTCDLSAGFVERPTHNNTTWEQARFEVCHHQWADLGEADFGVALLNNGKYGISCRENRVGLSLLRGTVRPDPFADEGVHRFSYALLPHEGSHAAAGVTHAARQFNTPLRIFSAKAAPASPLFKIDSSNLHVQAIKAPENGDPGLIVRLCECHGNRGTAEFALQRPITAAHKTDMLEDPCDDPQPEFRNGNLVFSYKPFEIITFKLTVN